MRKDKSQKIGQCLSENDVKSLRTFVSTLSKNCLLPAIEQTILSLGKEIKSQTGGFFRMSKFMRSAKRLTREQASRGVLLYPFNSVEAQIRRYADLMFMLGQYSMAHDQYEKIRSDFQQDKSWAHLAGTMEMIGICKLLSSTQHPPKKSTTDAVLDNMMNAVERYGRMSEKNPNRTKLVTRATLLLVDCCRILGSSFMRVAAETLVKSSSAETQLCSALMLQDAAFCYLHAKPLSFNRNVHFILFLLDICFTSAVRDNTLCIAISLRYLYLSRIGMEIHRRSYPFHVGSSILRSERLRSCSVFLSSTHRNGTSGQQTTASLHERVSSCRQGMGKLSIHIIILNK